MAFDPKKIIHEQTWQFQNKENAVNQTLCQTIIDQGFTANDGNHTFWRNDQIISYRLTDSVFLHDPDAWIRPPPNAIVTDNIPLQPVAGQLLSVLPEYWGINAYNPVYQNQEPAWSYNCFMNRLSGDRAMVFYELVRRKILDRGLVSFNCLVNGLPTDDRQRQLNYDQQYISADLVGYEPEHHAARQMIPYNNILEYQGLESCIIASNISLVLETYISDSHIAFSEKTFRVLQMPRPWLLHCSPESVTQLRNYGFDVLDDYVDHSYDHETRHNQRLIHILDQLETFVGRQFVLDDYERFQQAAKHNQSLLQSFANRWPHKLATVINGIKKL